MVMRPIIGAFPDLSRPLFLRQSNTFIFSVFIRFDVLWQNYQFQSVPHLCRKLPTEATATRVKIIQLPNITPLLPMVKSGNVLVTELLLKSAYYCPLRTGHFYANHFVSSSLSVSLRQLRFLFIFVDQLLGKSIVFTVQKHRIYTIKPQQLSVQSMYLPINSYGFSRKRRLRVKQDTKQSV